MPKFVFCQQSKDNGKTLCLELLGHTGRHVFVSNNPKEYALAVWRNDGKVTLDKMKLLHSKREAENKAKRMALWKQKAIAGITGLNGEGAREGRYDGKFTVNTTEGITAIRSSGVKPPLMVFLKLITSMYPKDFLSPGFVLSYLSDKEMFYASIVRYNGGDFSRKATKEVLFSAVGSSPEESIENAIALFSQATNIKI